MQFDFAFQDVPVGVGQCARVLAKRCLSWAAGAFLRFADDEAVEIRQNVRAG